MKRVTSVLTAIACAWCLSVTLPAHAPQMPPHMVAEVQSVLGRANYLAVTWDLMCRKAKDHFDGQRVRPGLPN